MMAPLSSRLFALEYVKCGLKCFTLEETAKGIEFHDSDA